MLIILSVGSIHSQTTLSTGKEPAFFSKSRPITYRNLNEALKYADYKYLAEKKDSVQRRQLATKDSIIAALQQINNTYKFSVIPNLEHQVSLYEQKEISNEKLSDINDERWQLKYDKLKAKRFGFGAYAGYGASSFGLSPSIGVSVNYTLIRF